MLKPGVQSTLLRGLVQWLWFLGVDTRDPDDNLLVRHGFVKFRPPGTDGSSRYRTEWRGNRVELHGYCVGVYPEHADGFIFIRARNQCFVYTAPDPPIPARYDEDCLIAADTEETTWRFHAAATRFLDWLEEYEQWVDRACGSGYRDVCYEACHLKWQPPAIGRAWFRSFCRRPHTVEPMTPVVPDMALLEANSAPDGKRQVPPPLPVQAVARKLTAVAKLKMIREPLPELIKMLKGSRAA